MLYQIRKANDRIHDIAIKRIIFVDKNKLAHWSYLITFMSDATNAVTQRPVYIVDAVSYYVYRSW